MEHLFVTVGASTLYAIAISVGYGRKLDEWGVTRPLVVAGGVMIVLTGYSRMDWAVFSDLFIWFAMSAIPQLVRVAIMFIQEQERKKPKEHTILDANTRVADEG